MSYGNSDGSDGSSAGGYGSDSSSSSSAGSCGDDSSSSSSSGNFGSDSSSSSSNDDSNSNSSGVDSTSDSNDNSDSGSNGDSSNVNSDSSAAAENASSIDSSSSLTGTQLDGSAGSSLNPSVGVVGGTLCSDDIGSSYNDSTYSGISLDGTAGAALASPETSTAYSFSGYISDNYDSTVASSYQNTMDMSGFQNTEVTEPSLLGSAWNSVAQWADQNVVQPLQGVYNDYVAQPLNNVESALSTTYDEGLKAVNSLIHDNKSLDNIVNHPENIKLGEVALGTVQAIGGFTELDLGRAIAAGGTVISGGKAAVPSLAAGGYLMVDGSSNMTGGVSRVVNGIAGTSDGDTANFVKNAYIEYGPSADKIYSGANLYNSIELGIGGYSLVSGLTNLAKNAVSIENSYLGYQATTQGAETWSSISSTFKNINYSQWTTGGLAVKSVDINLGNIGTRTLNFGIDGTNASQSIPSMPKSNEMDKND